MQTDARRRLSPEERRDELLAFGQVFFADHPVDAFSMLEIAKRAGVSKGLLYNYFGGRRGFYVATVRAIAADVADLTEPEDDMSFADAFRRALERYLDWVKDNGDAYRVLVQGGLGVDDEVGVIVEGLRRTSADRIARRAGLRRNQAIDLALYGWACFAEHACLEWISKRGVSRAAMVSLLTGALMGALMGCGVQIDA